MSETREEFDERVLAAFRQHGRMKDSELENAVFGKQGRHLRKEIEGAIDRLLEAGLIKDTSEEMDWHAHYEACNPLEILARIPTDRRRRQ